MAQESDKTTPGWVLAIVWTAVSGGVVAGGMLSDGYGGGWGWIAFGGVLGIALGIFLRFAIMIPILRSRGRRFAQAKTQRDIAAAAFERAEQNAVVVAREKFPHLIDEATLLDEDGAYFWPADLFAQLFKIPDAVVSFEALGGDGGEVRLWSKKLIEENSQYEKYLAHKEQVEYERREREREQQRKAEDEAREEDRRHMAEEEEWERMRVLEERKAQQVVVSVEELKRDRH